MCDCIIMGMLSTIDGRISVNGTEVSGIPSDLYGKIISGRFYYKELGREHFIADIYEYKKGKFKKTLKARIYRFLKRRE